MHLYVTRLLALSPTIINLLSARVCPRLALSCCVCRPLQRMRAQQRALRPDYSSALGGGIGGSNRTWSGASPSSTLSTRELKLIEIRGLLSSVPFLFPLPRLALLTTRQSV